jgi:hypothetical protein
MFQWQNSVRINVGKKQAGYGMQSHASIAEMDVAQPLSIDAKVLINYITISADAKVHMHNVTISADAKVYTHYVTISTDATVHTHCVTISEDGRVHICCVKIAIAHIHLLMIQTMACN